MAWIQRVLAWTQYISSSGLWNNTHDVDRVYICSARLGQRSAWLAPTQRRTGEATSLCGHLTRSCSFGRGHVWLYCHSWSGMCGPCHILCGPTVTHCHTLSHTVTHCHTLCGPPVAGDCHGGEGCRLFTTRNAALSRNRYTRLSQTSIHLSLIEHLWIRYELFQKQFEDNDSSENTLCVLQVIEY